MLKLTQTAAQIEKEILNALVKEANHTFRGALQRMTAPIQRVVNSAIASSPEIASLRSGTLRADFGITTGVDVTSPIINAVANSVNVYMQPFSVKGVGISGGISVNIQPDNFENLLSLGIGTTVTEKGDVLPWLDWLLNLGDAVIIADFGVEYGSFGRSGGARMSSGSRPFKVDSAFSGTVADNFITRALESRQKQLIDIIARSV
tara:strand:+ start:199 stop:813 length:615 start_codon:yes stop_codon:yes gene_type:complete